MRGGQAAADVRAEPTKPGKTHYIPSNIPLIGGQDLQVPSLQGATAILTDIAPDVAREAAAFLLGAKAAEATESVASADDIAQFIARRTAGWSPQARLTAAKAILNAGPKNLGFMLGSGGVTGDPKQDALNIAVGAVLFGVAGGAWEYARLLKGETKGARPGGELVAVEGRGEARPEAGQAASPLHDQAGAIQAKAAAQSARFQGMVEGVAGKTSGRAVVASIKTVENMIGKARRSNPADPGAALSGMKDVLRASIVVPDWESYKVAARELASRASEIDNSLTVPKKSGYKGLHFTIDLGDGVRAEVQLHVEETYALAHGSEGTHGLYEGVRDVLHLPPDQVPPERRAQVDEYMRVVTPRYVAVKIPEDVTSELSSLRPSGPGSGR